MHDKQSVANTISDQVQQFDKEFSIEDNKGKSSEQIEDEELEGKLKDLKEQLKE